MRYKVGDKVKLLKEYSDHKNYIDYFKDEIGEIDEISESGKFSWVNFGKGFRKDVWNCDLELIQENHQTLTNKSIVFDSSGKVKPREGFSAVKTCQHKNWKTVQMVYTKYDYCLDCKHDWNERNIRDK